MRDFFSKESKFYPFRWFIVIAAVLTLAMSWLDYGGYRMLSFSGSSGRSSYYGGPSGHK